MLIERSRIAGIAGHLVSAAQHREFDWQGAERRFAQFSHVPGISWRIGRHGQHGGCHL
jgi:hypothetical protein